MQGRGKVRLDRPAESKDKLSPSAAIGNMDWTEKIPTWVKVAFAVGGPMLSASASRLPDFLQLAALWSGIVLCIVGVVGLILHFYNEYKSSVAQNQVVLGSAVLTMLLVASFGCWRFWPASLFQKSWIDQSKVANFHTMATNVFHF